MNDQNSRDTSELLHELLNRKDPALIGVRKILKGKEGISKATTFHPYTPEILQKNDNNRSKDNETIFNDSEKEILENTKDTLELLKKIEELENNNKRAVEEAYAQGVDVGIKDGLSQLENKLNEREQELIQQQSGSLAELVSTQIESRNRFFDDVEQDLTQLAVNIAQKIIQKEVSTDKDIILNSVKRALSFVAGKSEISIKVSTNDHPKVQEVINTLTSTSDYIISTNLIADSNIIDGGCMIETSYGVIDARVDKQLDEIIQLIEESTKESSDETSI